MTVDKHVATFHITNLILGPLVGTASLSMSLKYGMFDNDNKMNFHL